MHTRAAAIRNAMERIWILHVTKKLIDTIFSAGYADGGAVGIMNAKRGLVDGPGGYSGDYVGSSDNETIEDEYDSYIKEIEIDGDTPMSFSSFKKMIESDYAKSFRW